MSYGSNNPHDRIKEHYSGICDNCYKQAKTETFKEEAVKAQITPREKIVINALTKAFKTRMANQPQLTVTARQIARKLLVDDMVTQTNKTFEKERKDLLKELEAKYPIGWVLRERPLTVEEEGKGTGWTWTDFTK